jgi:type VI secretion system secreted protein Hcp
MPSDYLLEIDDIKGESLDTKHKDTIEIASYSSGVTNSGSQHSGPGGGAGKASFQDIHFTSKVSKASPLLLQACSIGKHFNKATLYVRKSTGDGGQQEYLQIKLEDIIVSSYQVGGANGEGSGEHSIPTEQFSLNYGKITFEYKPQTDKGALGATVTGGYNIKEQKKI